MVLNVCCEAPPAVCVATFLDNDDLTLSANLKRGSWLLAQKPLRGAMRDTREMSVIGYSPQLGIVSMGGGFVRGRDFCKTAFDEKCRTGADVTDAEKTQLREG
jgi:hypothetical protein